LMSTPRSPIPSFSRRTQWRHPRRAMTTPSRDFWRLSFFWPFYYGSRQSHVKSAVKPAFLMSTPRSPILSFSRQTRWRHPRRNPRYWDRAAHKLRIWQGVKTGLIARARSGREVRVWCLRQSTPVFHAGHNGAVGGKIGRTPTALHGSGDLGGK
jgi:hypothetical protein